MKRKIRLTAGALLLVLSATAQINDTGTRGRIARATLLLEQTVPAGTLDQLRPIDIASLPFNSEERTMILEAEGEFGTGNYTEARRILANFAERFPFSTRRAEVAGRIGDCYYAAGLLTEALKAYRAVNTDGLTAVGAAELNYRMGVCALENGETDQARKALEAATANGATRSNALFYLGLIDYTEGDYTAARRNFQGVSTMEAPGNLAPFYLTEIDFAEGQWSRAANEARRQLRRQDLPADVRTELMRVAGESLIRSGERSQGLELLRKYIAESGQPAASALYLVGVADYGEADYSAALENLRRVTDDGEADPAIIQSAYLYIGQILLHEDNSESALLAFDKASKMDADSAVREAAFYNYAVAKFSGGNVPFGSSAETFEEFLRLYPTGQYADRVREYLVSGYLADNNYDMALERLRGIKRPTDKVQEAKQQVLYALGSKAYSAGRLSEARKLLDEAATLAKYNRATAAEVSLMQGQCYLHSGDAAAAAPKFRNYLTTASRTAPNHTVAQYGLGYALFGQKKYTEAAGPFAQVVAGNAAPATKADAFNRLGDIAYYGSDFGTAADYYQKAYEANPQSGDYAAFNLARMKGYERDYEGKLKALNAFREQFPASALMPDVLLETTQAQISLGRNGDAVNTYRQLTGSYPRTAQGRKGYLQMALTLLDMNRRDEAIEAYREVISNYPTSEEALQASALLKKLYSEDGRGTEYLAFMSSVENAPEVSAEDAERLRYETALRKLTDAEKTGDAGRLLLAGEMLEHYPDTYGSELALRMLAEDDYSAGRIPEALERWKQLDDKASDASMAGIARLGKMRAERDLGDYEQAGATADLILASSASVPALSEAKFTKALALDAADKSTEAIEIWKELAADPADLYGAKGAVYAAESLLEEGKTAEALKVAKALTSSGSAHRYWVARGFIVMADCFTAQGKKFEAKEYLEALRDNYPGTETDITTMIETRLSE